MSSSRSKKARAAARERARRRRRRNSLIGAGAAIVIAGVVAAALAGGDSTADTNATAATSPIPGTERAGGGEPVPNLQFERFGTGDVDELDNYVGRPLVINFFASWCVPCLAELPRFQATWLENRDQVEFLGLNLQDSTSSAAQVIETTGITYPIGIDPDGRLFQALGGFGMPTTVFLHADGTLAERYTGELSAEQLRTKLAEHGMIDPGTA